MARTINMTIVVVLVLIVALHGTEAAVHVVGGTFGWQDSPPNSTFYSTWAAGQTFSVGDTLTFNFATGVHSVATVSNDTYASCNLGNATNVISTGPATITLNSRGMSYYICTFSGHCAGGQKLAVNVTGGTTSPSPPGSTVSPPPPPSGSSNLAVNLALMMFTSIIMGYLCYL